MSESTAAAPQAARAEPASLAHELLEFQRKLREMVPPEMHTRLAAAIERMVVTHPGASALRVGR